MIIEEIIDKAISRATLITTNEGEETIEGDVVVEILEEIEKEDTIEMGIKETGPIREIGEVMVEIEEDVVEVVIIIVDKTETTIDNKANDPKGIGNTRISLKLICRLFTPSETPSRRSFCVLIISGISENCENERNNIYKRKEQKVFKQFI